MISNAAKDLVLRSFVALGPGSPSTPLRCVTGVRERAVEMLRRSDPITAASGEGVDHAVDEVRLVEGGGVDEAAAADLADGVDHLAQRALLLAPQRFGFGLRNRRKPDRAAGA